MIEPHTEIPPGEAGFAKFLETHAAVMYRQAFRILGNRQDAEDAVQDAMMRIWIHRRSFKRRSRLSTWIFRITYNACLALQARRHRAHMFEAGSSKELSEREEPQVPGGESPPGSQDVARLLSLLPPVQAAALSLFYVEELEYKEIAQVLKIPPGSVATAIHRGKRRLRDILTRHHGGVHGEL